MFVGFLFWGMGVIKSVGKSLIYLHLANTCIKYVITRVGGFSFDRRILSGKIGNIELTSISPVTFKTIKMSGDKLTRTSKKTLD